MEKEEWRERELKDECKATPPADIIPMLLRGLFQILLIMIQARWKRYYDLMKVMYCSGVGLKIGKRDIVIEPEKPRPGGLSQCIFIYVYTGEGQPPNDD